RSKISRGPHDGQRCRAPADRNQSPAFAGSVRRTDGVRLYRASGGRRAMKVWMIGLGAIVLVVAASAGGFWIGHNQHETAPAPARKVLYYRNPMGQPDTSSVPKKDSMG